MRQTGDPVWDEPVEPEPGPRPRFDVGQTVRVVSIPPENYHINAMREMEGKEYRIQSIGRDSNGRYYRIDDGTCTWGFREHNLASLLETASPETRKPGERFQIKVDDDYPLSEPKGYPLKGRTFWASLYHKSADGAERYIITFPQILANTDRSRDGEWIIHGDYARVIPTSMQEVEQGPKLPRLIYW